MGRLRAATLLLVALAAGLLLSACGSSGKGELLPGTTADQITSNLDLVRESNAEGNCEEAEQAVAQINEEIDALQKVDTKLKAALEEGATKLSEVVNSCGAGAEAEEQKETEEAQAEEEQEQTETEEAQAEEEQKSLEKEQKVEEKALEKAEKEAEQPGPSEEGEESGPKGKAKGHESQEEIEPPSEEEGEEVIPPVEEGPAGGIGPGTAAGGG